MPFITAEVPLLPPEFEYTGEYRSVRAGEYGLGIRRGDWSVMQSVDDADLPLFIIKKVRAKPCLTLITDA